MAVSDTTQAATARPPKAGLVTRRMECNLGALDLFAVQPGVDVNVALGVLASLLEAARGSADHLAKTLEEFEGEVPTGAPMAPVFLLDLAVALNESILNAHCHGQGEVLKAHCCA